MTHVLKWVIGLGLAYPGGFLLGFALREAILRRADPDGVAGGRSAPDLHAVTDWVLLCEYLLVATFTLAGDFTAVALIVAVMAFTRGDRLRASSGLPLLVMLLNVNFALIFALLARLILR